MEVGSELDGLKGELGEIDQEEYCSLTLSMRIVHLEWSSFCKRMLSSLLSRYRDTWENSFVVVTKNILRSTGKICPTSCNIETMIKARETGR